MTATGNDRVSCASGTWPRSRTWKSGSDPGFSVLTGRDRRREIHHHRQHHVSSGRQGVVRPHPDRREEAVVEAIFRRRRQPSADAPCSRTANCSSNGDLPRTERAKPTSTASSFRSRGSASCRRAWSISMARTITSSSSSPRTIATTSTNTPASGPCGPRRPALAQALRAPGPQKGRAGGAAGRDRSSGWTF